MHSEVRTPPSSLAEDAAVLLSNVGAHLEVLDPLSAVVVYPGARADICAAEQALASGACAGSGRAIFIRLCGLRKRSQSTCRRNLHRKDSFAPILREELHLLRCACISSIWSCCNGLHSSSQDLELALHLSEHVRKLAVKRTYMLSEVEHIQPLRVLVSALRLLLQHVSICQSRQDCMWSGGRWFTQVWILSSFLGTASFRRSLLLSLAVRKLLAWLRV
mmetsp:Transcript_70617/g.169206  ORF Transcript_70617/g.169206 Transcript_70617/m.169206 type:complete len:219 (+) Transcript_70617:147-803(+)